MNKCLTVFSSLFLAVTISYASVSLIMPNRTGQSGTQITIPVKVKNFNSIISAQGTIQWNPAVVTYVSVQQYGLAGMTAGNFGILQVNSGKLTFSWFQGDLVGQSLPDSAVLFSVTFNIIGSNGQSTALSFVNSPTAMEVVNSSFVTESLSLVNGSITVQNNVTPPDITLYYDTISGNQGSQVTVSLRAVDFVNIVSVQGTVQFDPSVVTYTGISYYGLPNMTAGNFGTSLLGSGKLTFSWSDGTLSGVNLADSAAIFSMTFNLSGSPGTQSLLQFASSPTVLEVIDSLYNTLTTNAINGKIRIKSNLATSSIKVWCDTVTGPYGSLVTVSMLASHFTNIISMQGTLQFNTAVAVFDTIIQYGLPGMTISNFGLSQTGSGKLMYSWNDPTLAGVTVPSSSTLFTMQFLVAGGPSTSTPVSFIDSPTSQEYVDNTFATLVDTLVPGLINVTNNNTLTISNPSTLTYCTGAALTDSYAVTGLFQPGNLFILQISGPTGSFASPLNIDTVAGTTSGTFNCNIPLGLTQGTGYRLRAISTDPVMQSTPSTSNITINTPPAMPGSITGNTTVCSGSSNQYSIGSVSGATSYTWTLPAGWTGTSVTTVINTVAGASGGNITVTANNTCGASAQQTLPVTVNTVPAQPSAISGATNPCQGSMQTYSVTNVSGVNYVWNLPAGWTGNSTTSTINVTVGTSGGTISVMANNACGNSTARTLAVTVKPLPAQPVITGPSSVCAGSTGISYSTPNASGVIFNWTVPMGATITSGQGLNAITVNFSACSSGDICCTATLNGCSSAAGCLTLTPLLPAMPGSITSASPVCAGTSSQCSITPLVCTSTYQWIIYPAAAGTVSGSTATATINWTPGWSGIAYIKVKGINSCGNGPFSDSLAVVIDQPAAPVISVTPPTMSSSYSTGNQWYYNGSIIPGATGQTYTPTQNGNYYVIYTDSYGCIAQSNTVNYVWVGISSNLEEQGIEVYPNPNNGSFILEWQGEGQGKMNIFVYSSLGEMILAKEFDLYNDHESILIDLTAAAPGIYLLQAATQSSLIKRKIIIR